MRLLERKQLEKDVFKALNEAISKRKTPIYTISAYDIDYDAAYEELKYDGQIYYSEEEAVEAAREWCYELTSDDEPLICITVYKIIAEKDAGSLAQSYESAKLSLVFYIMF